MPLILVLQLPRSQKVGLVGIFGLGVLFVYSLFPFIHDFFSFWFGANPNCNSVCITSVVRMTVLKTGAVAADTSHGTLQSTIWTAVECHTAIICASLPMLKSTLTKIFPRLFPHSGASNTEVNTEMENDYHHHHHHHHHHPIPSDSSTPVNDDCEAAVTPVSPTWCYKYNHDHPTSLKICKEAASAKGHFCDHQETTTTATLSSHLDPKIIPAPTILPKVYCPKGAAYCHKGYCCPSKGEAACCCCCPPLPTDVITKTTDIDIRVEYAPRNNDDIEEGDSSSTDSIFRFGNQVSSAAANHNHNYSKSPPRQSRKSLPLHR